MNTRVSKSYTRKHAGAHCLREKKGQSHAVPGNLLDFSLLSRLKSTID